MLPLLYSLSEPSLNEIQVTGGGGGVETLPLRICGGIIPPTNIQWYRNFKCKLNVYICYLTAINLRVQIVPKIMK